MPPDFSVTELWQVLSGEKTGRDNAAQITMFDSVGFALEDFSALRYLHDTALALATGNAIALIPRLDDPKNLYQLIKPASDPLSASDAAAGPVMQADEKQAALA